MKLGRSSKQEKPDGTAGPTGMDKPEKLAGPGRQGRQAGLEKQDELNDQERWAGPNRRVKQSNSSWVSDDEPNGKRKPHVWIDPMASDNPWKNENWIGKTKCTKTQPTSHPWRCQRMKQSILTSSCYLAHLNQKLQGI